MTDRKIVGIIVAICLTLVFAISLGAPGAMAQKKLKFGVSLGACAHDFPARLREGFVDTCKELEVEMIEAVAQSNVNQQINDINKFITMKVDAILVWPEDPSALGPIAERAARAKIPFFTVDSCVFGAPFTCAVMSDNYRLGEVSAEYLAKQIGGKGNVALMNLPANEVWSMRTNGAKDGFAKHPDIKIVTEQHISFETGGLTATAAVENILAANPKPGSLKAIWGACDDFSIQVAQVCAAAGRTEIITSGIDGEQGAIDLMRKGSAIVLSMGQSPYLMARTATQKAYEYLQGRYVPRLIISSTWMITPQNLPVEGAKWSYDNIHYIRQYGELKDRI